MALTCVALTACLLPSQARAEGPNAIMKPALYDANAVARGDDTSNLVVNLPFAMNWSGTSFTQIYINMNGNCTFGAGYNGYNPSTTLAATNRNIMAPLWADVDTRNSASGLVTYSSTTAGSVPQVNGRDAFFVNWMDVASYNYQTTPTNSFQLVLVDRSDTGAGNFDFIFNYDKVTWDIATAASTVRGRAGWGQAGTGFELPGSGTPESSPSMLLDSSGAATSLIQNSLNSGGQLGRYVFEVRNGQAPNIPPQISVTNRTLEGNASNTYVGYTGTGDVVATDPDGTIASLTNNMPTVLPLGTTTVTWTATDDRGSVTTAQQTILVRDTTPPTNPALTSPTQTTGVWTTNNTVTVNSAGSTDVCTGVNGFSYAWNQGSPATPDTTLDPANVTQTPVDVPVTVDSQTFETATWPPGWIVSDNTWVRLTNAAGRTRGSYAPEIWASNNTRRTANFYRDYDLTTLTSATLAFWDNTSLSRNGSYARVEYSINGGTSYTLLQEFDSGSSTGWTARSHTLPVGGVVRVRFSASVARAAEYADWDDISVTGVTTQLVDSLSTSTTSSLADGRWYFNLHAVDNSGNWSSPVNMGPFLIDRTAPVTTDNAPAGWSTTNVSVTLTAADAGVVAQTRYRLNGGAITNYSGPILVSTEGTSTLQYWSVDGAGNTEAPKTATVRVDRTPPTVPSGVTANAIASDEVEVNWTASTDAVSGLSYYRIYRDGSVVATTSATTLTDIGVTPNTTYVYTVVAVDRAGNSSAPSLPASVFVPSAVLWMTISDTTVDLNPLDPGVASTVTSATAVTVGGYGTMQYDLACSADDFVNSDPLSPTPTLGIGAMSYATRGWIGLPTQPFTIGPHVFSTSTGGLGLWEHRYIFDYSIDTPWTSDPGTYTTTVTYTVVLH